MLLLLTSLFIFAVSQDICDFPADEGVQNCPGTNGSIRFFHDTDTQRCLGFHYSGCGGNENNFVAKHLCQQRCSPQDRVFCSANTPRVPNGQPDSFCNSTIKCTDPESYCHEGPHRMGTCCLRENRRKVREDLKTTCSNGQAKYVLPGDSFHQVFFAKSCSPKLCPSGYSCQKGNFYSFCCLN